jgi:hypothetical protein
MKIPMIEGRDFTRGDVDRANACGSGDRTSPCQVIVNRKFAEHFFPGQRAVGKHVGQGVRPDTKLDIEIIGVVENSLYEGPREGVHRQVFAPNWGRNSATFYVRTLTSSTEAFNQIRRDVRQLDAALPVYQTKTVQGQLDETLLSDRLTALLAAGFGLLATLLASIGLYAVMAFVVTRRTKEIGVRLALGARPRLVVWLVMREVLMLLAIGLAVGLPTALGAGRFVASQLYGIQARDPWTAGATLILLTLVAAAAGLIPARRATRIDPILALRCE